jgi:branched-chain amino acid aminotransferase
MARAVSIDGQIIAPEDAKVSVYDRGFLYGDGVFETLRTYRGAPFALEEHAERLAASARAVGIALPVPLRTLERETVEAVHAAANPESTIRILITRGQGPLRLDPTGADSPLRVILVEPLAPPPAEIYRAGVTTITERTERAADAAPGAKVTNYLAGMLALRRAGARGAHEALLLDAEGCITEGVTSNFFLVIEGELLTAPRASVLAGVTRARVLAIASRLGIPARHGAIGRNDLESASEAFLTSTLRELVPVTHIDTITIGDGTPGPVTRRLHLAFRESAGIGDEPPPWA